MCCNNERSLGLLDDTFQALFIINLELGSTPVMHIWTFKKITGVSRNIFYLYIFSEDDGVDSLSDNCIRKHAIKMTQVVVFSVGNMVNQTYSHD